MKLRKSKLCGPGRETRPGQTSPEGHLAAVPTGPGPPPGEHVFLRSGAGDAGFRVELDPDSHQMQKLAQRRAKVRCQRWTARLLEGNRCESGLGNGLSSTTAEAQVTEERCTRIGGHGVMNLCAPKGAMDSKGASQGENPAGPHVYSGHAARSSRNSTERQGAQFSHGQRT